MSADDSTFGNYLYKKYDKELLLLIKKQIKWKIRTSIVNAVGRG